MLSKYSLLSISYPIEQPSAGVPPRQLVTESEQHIRLFAEFNKTATVPFFLMGKVFWNVRVGGHRDAIYSTF